MSDLIIGERKIIVKVFMAEYKVNIVYNSFIASLVSASVLAAMIRALREPS